MLSLTPNRCAAARAYKRILVPFKSADPSVAQLTDAAAIAAQNDSAVRVTRFVESCPAFPSDGPTGTLADKVDTCRLPLARKRLDMQLARSYLFWAHSSVFMGDPTEMLACEMRDWQPDLVIVSSGFGRKVWVKAAAELAGIATPEIWCAETRRTPLPQRPGITSGGESGFRRWLERHFESYQLRSSSPH